MVPIRIFLAVLPYRAGYLGTDIDVAQDPHTPVIKGLACHRQVDTSGRPDKQLNAEFALKRPDLRRQGRLGDMHPGCRPTEMELLGNVVRSSMAGVPTMDDRVIRLSEFKIPEKQI